MVKHRSRRIFVQPSEHCSPERRTVGIALSGGGSHGAFAAGLIHATFRRYLERETLPQLSIVAGTSTGALIAGLLVQMYGRVKMADPHRPPGESLALLERLYTKTTQREVGRNPKCLCKIGWNLFTKKGAMDIRPLRVLIERYYEHDAILAAARGLAPTSFCCNYVDMPDGQLRRVAPRDSTDNDAARVVDAIFASCAQPVVMTPAFVDERWATDGGVREVIPIREAMALGCTHVLAIALNEPELDGEQKFIKGGKFDALTMIKRGLAVMNDEVARDDERLGLLAAYIQRARDEVSAYVGSSTNAMALLERAFPREKLPVVTDSQTGVRDPYGNDTYNDSVLRHLEIFRFPRSQLPNTEEFDPASLEKMFADGTAEAEQRADIIDSVLGVAESCAAE